MAKIEMLKNLFLQVLEQLNIYYGSGIFLAFTIVAAIYLTVSGKETRKKLIYPLLAVLLVILNPVVYYLAGEDFVYWRMFWLIPDALLMGLAATRFVRGFNSTLKKCVAYAVLTVMLIFFGTNIFTAGEFSERANAYGIWGSCKDVADTVLKDDPKPRCICPYTLTMFLREYNGDIETMYGRDIEGYITASNQKKKEVSHEIEADEPDYDFLLSVAVYYGYDHIITYDRSPIREETLTRFGYEYLDSTGGYTIYRSMNRECVFEA